jgi:hypothetical protein
MRNQAPFVQAPFARRRFPVNDRMKEQDMGKDQGRGEFRRGTGALPPPDAAWQLGKTAASITFVKEIDRFLDGVSEVVIDGVVITSAQPPVVVDGLDPADELIELFFRAMRYEITSGNLVLTDWATLKGFYDARIVEFRKQAKR